MNRHTEIKEYTLGFAFDRRKNYVALIQKTHPEWQAGLLNGIGGHKEKEESFEQCMIREFEEETGVRHEDWTFFLVLRFPDALVHCYYTIMPLENLKSMTEEKIWLTDVISILKDNFSLKVITNLRWIIPLALSYESELFQHYIVYHTPRFEEPKLQPGGKSMKNGMKESNGCPEWDICEDKNCHECGT